jgi:glycosyltransferase involved in cell wall biosynthesis
MTSVCICVPATGVHKSHMALALASLSTVSALHGIQIGINGQDLAGIARNRNLLVQIAIDSGADYVLFLDSDMTFPPDMLLKLLAHGKDIVGVPYPKRQPPYELLGAPLNPADAQSGLAEFEWLPSGLMLIKTDVFRKLPAPWYFESYPYDGELETQFGECLRDALAAPVPDTVVTSLTQNADLLAWFNEAFATQRLTQERSEDTNFCRKARRHGYQIWADVDLLRQIGHIGEHTIRVGQ